MFQWLDNGTTYLVKKGFKLSVDSSLGGSVHFFIYDTIKILILLSMMIFAVSYLRSYFPPTKMRALVEKMGGIKAHIAGSLLGIITPFCSCSSVPLFIGFVRAGIPLGVTFSFLITSPIVNEAAFIILLASFGWKVAGLYVIFGVILGVVGGMVLGKFNLKNQLEQRTIEQSEAVATEEALSTQKQRIVFAWENVRDIIKKVWLFLLIGIGIGALIHGFAPTDLLTRYAGPDNPLAVMVATVLAVPLYSNALGTIPIAQALLSKGVGLGTAMAFMMATTAISLPEIILLRQVIKNKLIAYFILVVTLGIILIGFAFNFFSFL